MSRFAQIIAAALALFAGSVSAYCAPGDIVGEVLYPDGPANFDVRVSDAAPMPDGGFVFTGTVAYDTDNRDMLTVRFSPGGELVWSLSFDESLHDVSSALCVDTDGNVTVAGAALDYDYPKDEYLRSYHTGYRIIRYSPDGELLFEADGAGYERSNMPVDIVLAPDGGAIATGTATNPQESYDFVYTVRYGPGGETLYETYEDFGIETHPVGIALAPGGRLYMAAYVYDEFNEHFDIRLVAYDPEDGVFDEQFRHMDYYHEFTASAITGDLMGNVVVVGMTDEDGGRALALKYSPDGKLLWERLYVSSYMPTHADAVTADPAGRIYVVGSEKRAFDRTDVLLYVISPDGDMLADKVYPFDEECDPVAVFLDGRNDVNIALTFVSPDTPGVARLLRVEGWPMGRVRLTLAEAAGGSGIRLRGGILPVYEPMYYEVGFRPLEPWDGYHFNIESGGSALPCGLCSPERKLNADTLIVLFD